MIQAVAKHNRATSASAPTSVARYNEMTAKGWNPEGIVFCAASGTAATH